MYRFSVERDIPITANTDQLVTAGITEDESFAETLRETGDYREDERYFRVENRSPFTLREAIEYAQGVLAHVPVRVWLKDQVHEIDEDDLRNVRKPGG